MSITAIEQEIKVATAAVVSSIFETEATAASVAIKRTPKEFEGQFTVVVFPFVRFAKKSPEETGALIGEQLVQKLPAVKAYNTVKGFLNLELTADYWQDFLFETAADQTFGQLPSTGETISVEYCGPNTNKPLHLGHVRNMLLGWSTSAILKAAGHQVHKVNIYNDRGIAICKSMAAYLNDGQETTPEQSGLKGDHLVGKFYVAYNNLAKEQAQALIEVGTIPEDTARQDAEKHTEIYKSAVSLLQKWEAGDEETLALWRKMNSWVYAGFNETYKSIGVDFEKDYCESDTYLLGKEVVMEGLEKGLFTKWEDGSIRVDLTEDGLDQKVLLRSDGTAMYITQDLGTADSRFSDYAMQRSIYVVGSEQDYHFKVLKLLLQKLGRPYADGIYHLSYGMVDLPTGKMKSREGTTVDADHLISQMTSSAEEATKERGKADMLEAEAAEQLYRQIGLSALKYFILKVDPRKRILFDPKESINLNGNTGPFIQYTHARIKSMERQYNGDSSAAKVERALAKTEIALLAQLQQYPFAVAEAADKYSPAEVANYTYDLAKLYNRFYAECPILNAEDPKDTAFRMQISSLTASVINKALALLGIDAPDQM